MPLLEKVKIPTDKHSKDLLKNALGWAIFFVLGFVFSTGTVINEARPFGISLVAVSKKPHFLFSATGAILGYLAGGITAQSIKYSVAVVIALLGAIACEGFDLRHNPSFAMTISFLADFACGVIYNFQSNVPFSSYILTLGESVLSMGGAFFFFKTINTNHKRLRFKALPISDIACVVITISILFLNLSSLYIGLICPARIIATVLILSAIRYGGDRWGVVLSLCFGFALSIAQQGEIYIVGAMAFSAMVATLFSSLSNISIALVYLCTLGFFSVATINDELSLSLFIEALVASVIFLLTPSKISQKLEEIWDTGKDSPPDGSLRQSLVLKLRFASSAMGAISESVEQVRDKINEITRRDNDLKRDKISDTEYLMREIILEKTNQIRMVASDQFFSISGMLEDLAFEFDEAEIFDSTASSKIRRLLGEWEIYPKNISAIEDKYGRMRVEILVDDGRADLANPRLQTEIGKICNRYFEKGKITNFKHETMLSFFERPNYHLKVAFAQNSAEGNLCGDTVKIINDNKGHTILIISDGMGKGSRAALDGAMGAGLLAKLINASFGFDSALKVVNSALLVKSNDESLATLDIANIDLFTGKCEIFKAGAPASYIIKNNVPNKCELTSMPAGILRGIEFAKRTAVLSPNDSIVMMSDGICDLGDQWLYEKFLQTENLDLQQTADFILESAMKEFENKKMDDMSVIYAKLERN